MSFDLKSIKTGTESRPPRVVLIGEEKVGKTTFASQWPNPLIVPVKGEEGCDALDISKTSVVEDIGGFMEIVEALCSQPHDFKTLIIDSISALEPLIWQAVCKADNKDSIEKVGGGFGKGYVEAVNMWRELMSAMDYIRNEKGMAIIMIGHCKVKSFSDPAGDNYDKYELDVNKQAMAAIQRWADCILFARWKAVTKKTGKDGEERKAFRSERILCGQTTGAFPAGGRGVYGHLPIEMKLDYESFKQAVKEAR